MRDEGSQLRVNKQSLHKRLDNADAYDPLRDNPRSPKPGRGRMSGIVRVLFQATRPSKSHATTR